MFTRLYADFTRLYTSFDIPQECQVHKKSTIHPVSALGQLFATLWDWL